MSVRDTIALLRELDPVDGARERRPAVRRRRRVGRVLVVAALAAIAVAVGLAPSADEGRPPGFAETAYAALVAPDRILHLKVYSEFHHPADDPATTEMWVADAGRRLRAVYDGGEHEFVRDTDRRYAASYVRRRNELTVFTEPMMWRWLPSEELNFAGPEGPARLAVDLPALLERARDGDPAVRRLPDAELDGRLAARLETTASMPTRDADGTFEPTAVRTVVWFDLDTHLPRRIERYLGERLEATYELLVAETLELDEDTEALLRVRVPPDARRETFPRSDG